MVRKVSWRGAGWSIFGVDVLQQVSSWWGRESVVRGVSWRWRGVVGGDVPLWSCFLRFCGMEQVPCHRSWLGQCRDVGWRWTGVVGGKVKVFCCGSVSSGGADP